MSGMTEPRELLLHELGDLLYAEQLLTKALPKLAEEAGDNELKRGFPAPSGRDQAARRELEAGVRVHWRDAKAEKCPGIEGIKAEHDAFMSEEDPSQEIRDMFLTGRRCPRRALRDRRLLRRHHPRDSLGESERSRCSRRTWPRRRKRSPRLETIAKRLGSDQKTAA